MWKKKLDWKNDSIEFTFQDQVVIVSLEESIQDEEMRFKATMKNGNQIKKVELKITIQTVSEEKENNNPVRTEKQDQEFYEQGSLLNPIKLEETNNETKHAHQEECELRENAELIKKKNKQKDSVADAFDVKQPDAKKYRKTSALEVAPQTLAIATPSGDAIASTAMAMGPKQKAVGVVGVQSLGNNTVTIKDRKLIVQGPDHAEATAIARKLVSDEAKLGSVGGQQVLVMLDAKVT